MPKVIVCERWRSAAKSYSVCCVHGIGLLLCCGNLGRDSSESLSMGDPSLRKIADEAEGRISHAAGGVCPFGVKDGCDVCFDESLRRFDVICPACGSSNSAIALTPEELAQTVPAGVWVDACKPPAKGAVLSIKKPSARRRRASPLAGPRRSRRPPGGLAGPSRREAPAAESRRRGS